MAAEKEPENNGTFGIKYEERWQHIVKYHHGVEDFIHGNDGPWPQPAPDNPVGQMAEVVHLPEQEKIDWKKQVGNMYARRVLTCWPFGLWYALTHKEYRYFDDAAFNEEISEGLYSKFLTPLDEGDLEIFRQRLPDLDEDESRYFKADFSCMEPIAPHCYEGMYAAPTITLLKRDQSDVYGLRHQVVAIYLYEVEYTEGHDEPDVVAQKVFIPEDADRWHLAKYFVLQGAVHRVNLTEHALLHFPYDSINAITKTILPTSHLLFQLLIPHLELSLGVNKAVLENPGSLINRGKHKFYSPFCAEGIHIRKLLPDGYIGRGDSKKNAYPKYEFPYQNPRFVESDYGGFLKAYYDVFAEFVPKVLDQIEDEDEESWQYIALWVACIEEWMPGFPIAEKIVVDGRPVDRDRLNRIVTLVMWDLSLAHANDHIAIHNKRPHGNPFRLRVAPPTRGDVPADWHSKLVSRLDLLTFWFTDLLFYKPNNVTELQNVKYPFKITGEGAERKQQYLEQENEKFIAALHACESRLQEKGIHLSSRLNQISTSLQY
jgi:hypothetical protein